MDAGIGEMMLADAAVGGEAAAGAGTAVASNLVGTVAPAVADVVAPGISTGLNALGDAGGTLTEGGDALANTVPQTTSNIINSTTPFQYTAPQIPSGSITGQTLTNSTSSIMNPGYQGIGNVASQSADSGSSGLFDGLGNWISKNPWLTAGGVGLAGLLGSSMLSQNQYKPPGLPNYTGPLSKYSFNPNSYTPYTAQNNFGIPTGATGGEVRGYAQGGITALGGSNMFPGSQQNNTQFNVPSQMPNSAMKADFDPETNPYTGDISQNMASGGITSLGAYSDGGHLLKGPGDGMSDDIPARIGQHQEARLADGEFVIPADVVSHLGNGSTDAGAQHLYKMMDKVRKARTGNPKQGKRINPDKFMPKMADGGSVDQYASGFGGSSAPYSYADLMNQLRNNPSAFKTAPAVNPNNQSLGIQSIANNAAIAQAQQNAQNQIAAAQQAVPENYGSDGGP